MDILSPPNHKLTYKRYYKLLNNQYLHNNKRKIHCICLMKDLGMYQIKPQLAIASHPLGGHTLTRGCLWVSFYLTPNRSCYLLRFPHYFLWQNITFIVRNGIVLPDTRKPISPWVFSFLSLLLLYLGCKFAIVIPSCVVYIIIF